MKKRIATVLAKDRKEVSNSKRARILTEIVTSVNADVFVFPGGWFSAGRKRAEAIYADIEQSLKPIAGYSYVCLGVDGRKQEPWAKDQTALAISKQGIVACARKFHSAPTEKSLVELADSYLEAEADLDRFFLLDERHCYLAVCYDSFGIRHQNIKNPNIDIVLTSIHGFFPVGQGNSGDTYFVRHGLAGASKQWNCPVFGSAIFFDREIPENWQSGVIWDKGDTPTQYWSYADNPLEPKEIHKGKNLLVKIYEV
jgi:hypothetical protein